uniref:CUB domain-containing protein n=1 Tax=Heliothis virescens TaxID=7102 RepID=A0A2A4J843_HELVI
MALQRLLRLLLVCVVGYTSASIVDDTNFRTPRQNPATIFTVGNGEQCLSADRTTGGVCLSRNQCNTQGGKAIGFCGVFATCCSLNACDVRTNTKVAVFINPPLNHESSGLECSYNVEINNNNVCQMRIDFETFNLAPPTTVDPVENVTQRPGFTCRNDIFQVTNLQANSDILPPLCGDNNGQHLYVRVNASTNSRAIRINFKIADRVTQPNLPQATWKIKVTQLECFNTLGKFRDGIFESITQSLPATPFGGSSADRDEYLIAPPGCLQYYPDRSGMFESFNYNRGQGPYIGNLIYSTCFKKSPDVCGIKFTAATFNMAYRDESNIYLDTDCQVNPVTRGTPQSEDYLFIPEAETADGLRGTKFCGASAANQIIASTPPGPLYVHFKSDNLVTDGIPEQGYRFSYNVLNNCFSRI